VSPEPPEIPTRPEIAVLTNGPYLVSGAIRLSSKRALISEHGEPIAWVTAPAAAGERYALCRCGASDRKPFCDGTHARVGFDGSGPAGSGPVKDYPGTGIVVHDDRSACVHAGFCGTRLTNVWEMVAETEEPTVRSQVIAMVERCPSGALTWSVADDPDTAVEPDLPVAVGVVADGPLWVTGGPAITVQGGPTLPARNRVTLCRCGGSRNRPYCDGTHKEIGFTDAPA